MGTSRIFYIDKINKQLYLNIDGVDIHLRHLEDIVRLKVKENYCAEDPCKLRILKIDLNKIDMIPAYRESKELPNKLKCPNSENMYMLMFSEDYDNIHKFKTTEYIVEKYLTDIIDVAKSTRYNVTDIRTLQKALMAEEIASNYYFDTTGVDLENCGVVVCNKINRCGVDFYIGSFPSSSSDEDDSMYNMSKTFETFKSDPDDYSDYGNMQHSLSKFVYDLIEVFGLDSCDLLKDLKRIKSKIDKKHKSPHKAKED